MLELAGVATQRLSSFAEDLLVVSTLEVGEQSIRLTPLVVDDNVSALTNYAKTLADSKGIAFATDLQPTGISIQASRPYLGNAVWNVLDNAIKFTPVGGTVTFTVTVVADELVIAITDTGIGIGDTEKGKIFDKLHRGISTEQYDYEGSGISLYKTQKIIDAHHGTVVVTSQPGVGSTFELHIPVA